MTEKWYHPDIPSTNNVSTHTSFGVTYIVALVWTDTITAATTQFALIKAVLPLGKLKLHSLDKASVAVVGLFYNILTGAAIEKEQEEQ